MRITNIYPSYMSRSSTLSLNRTKSLFAHSILNPSTLRCHDYNDTPNDNIVNTAMSSSAQPFERATVPFDVGFVPVSINDIRSSAMIDTGSSFSYVSSTFGLGAHTTKPLTIHLADGSKTHVRSAKCISLHFRDATNAEYVMQHTMYVLPTLPLPCILGFDFLAKFQITVNCSTRNIQLATGALIPFESKRKTKLFAHAISSAISTAANAPTKVAQQDLYPRPTIGTSNLSDEQRARAQKMLDDLASAFATKDRPLGNCNIVLHRIRPQCAPFKMKLLSLSPKQIAVEKACIEEMLSLGVLVPSKSEWACRPSFAPKPDGSIRFCVNFRRLNVHDILDSYPLPRAPDLINHLTKCKFFTKLDAANGYWQIRIHPDDTKYTAVITHLGLFEHVRMPFGLSNAPATYQRLMDKILSFGLNKFCCVYLDDVLVYSETFEAHVNHVYRCITAMRDAGLLLKARKCSFFDHLVEYLGHVVGNGEMRMTMKKVRQILDFPIPNSVLSVQSFLGVTGYYRKFIRNFGPRVAPLHDLTKKGINFAWTSEHQRIFEEIQRDFNADVVLKLPDYSKRFLIDTDASDLGIGGVLSQLDEQGRERPVLFASRKLSPAELKWPIRDKEALAIIYALDCFRPYIWGSGIPFLVRTDHHSLEWMKDAKTGRIARWSTMLAEFEPFVIKYRKGSSNKVADALSRVFAWSECLPDVAFCGALLNNPVVRKGNPFDLICVPTNDVLYDAQRADDDFCIPRIASLAKYPKFSIQDAPLPNSSKTVKLLGILEKGIFRPVLPTHLVDQFIKSVHSNPLMAHMGAKRTAARCSELFVIPKLRQVTRQLCSSCIPCLQRKKPLQKVGKLSSVAPTRPWEMVSMDFCGPYPQSRRGNTYILVIIDQFSKYVNLIATAAADAANVLRAVWERIICVHGPPEKLLSDNGSHFVNASIASMCHSFRIFKVQSSPYYPQGDGQVERFMSTLNNSLSCLCQADTRDWCEFIAGIQYAYNTTPHAATFVSPYECIYGCKPPPLVRSNHIAISPLITQTAESYATRMKRTIERIQDIVRRNVQHAWMLRAIQYNANRSKITLYVGQHAMIRLSPLQLSKSTAGKLRVRWSEPALITAVRSSGNAFEVLTADNRTIVVNASRLLPMPPKAWKPSSVVKYVRWNSSVYNPEFVRSESVGYVTGTYVYPPPKPRVHRLPETNQNATHTPTPPRSGGAASSEAPSGRSVHSNSASARGHDDFDYHDDDMQSHGGSVSSHRSNVPSDAHSLESQESLIIELSDNAASSSSSDEPHAEPIFRNRWEWGREQVRLRELEGYCSPPSEPSADESGTSSSSSFPDDPLDLSIHSSNCPPSDDSSFDR